MVVMLSDDEKKKESSEYFCNFFKMPLHYPRYTKQEYEAMAEWQLDRLLSEYGLPVHGDLAYKKDFAMGAFLWPKHDDDDEDIREHELIITSSSGNSRNLKNFEEDSSSVSQNKSSVIGGLASFLYRALGYHA